MVFVTSTCRMFLITCCGSDSPNRGAILANVEKCDIPLLLIFSYHFLGEFTALISRETITDGWLSVVKLEPLIMFRAITNNIYPEVNVRCQQPEFIKSSYRPAS